MLSEKILSNDPTWDVHAQEEEFRSKLDADIRDLERDIATAERALALRASPGWEPFLKAVRALLDSRMEEMILAKGDREAAVLQGRVRELRTILSLMQRTESNLSILRERLQVRVKTREERVLGQKVKPLGATS